MGQMHIAYAILLWGCAALIFYVYFGYPLVIYCLARLFGRRGEPSDCPTEELPTLSLLICAYNEESVIEERIRNALALDYPADRLEIVVASDGSSDETGAIVKRYSHRGVRLLDYSRRGKAAVLNAAFPELRGDIILLSDANTMTDRRAARTIVRWFRDPQVGVVCGRLILIDSKTSRNADGLYWKYETFLKRCEGKLGALLGANGGIYAIRRDLFEPVPPSTMEDLLIPLQVKMRTRCRIVYDYHATAREETPEFIGQEFKRRSRYGAGGLQTLPLLWRLLDPRQGWVAFTFLSHKILRWLGPFFLLGALASNLLLIGSPFYRLLLAGQFAFYLASVVGIFVPSSGKLIKPLKLAAMFTSMNVALFVGFWRSVFVRQSAVWTSTTRHRTLELEPVTT